MHPPSGTNRSIILAAALLIGAAACAAPTEPRVSGACIGVTNVNGAMFVAWTGQAEPGRTYEQGGVVATVTKNRGCDDTPEVPLIRREGIDPAAPTFEAPFADGESNHLEVGTKLCAIVGESPALYLMICDRPATDPRIITSLHDEPIH
jgi:hypothetical protein